MPVETPVIVNTSGFLIVFFSWLSRACVKAWHFSVRLCSAAASYAFDHGSLAFEWIKESVATLPSKFSQAVAAISATSQKILNHPILLQTAKQLDTVNNLVFGWLKAFATRVPILNRLVAALSAIMHPLVATLFQTVLLIAILPYVIAAALAAVMFIYSFVMELMTQAVGNVLRFFSNIAVELYKTMQSFIQENIKISAYSTNLFNKTLYRTSSLVKLLLSPLLIITAEGLYLGVKTVLLPFSAAFSAISTTSGTASDVLNFALFRRITSPWQNIFGKFQDTTAEQALAKADAAVANSKQTLEQMQQTRAELEQMIGVQATDLHLYRQESMRQSPIVAHPQHNSNQIRADNPEQTPGIKNLGVSAS